MSGEPRAGEPAPLVGFDPIIFEPRKMDGRAGVRGLRIAVSLLVTLTANGRSAAELVEAYPDLEPEA